MKTVTVTVTIQMDIKDDSENLKGVQEVLDTMNTIVSQSELESQPQIFVSDISNSDIKEDEPAEEE